MSLFGEIYHLHSKSSTIVFCAVLVVFFLLEGLLHIFEVECNKRGLQGLVKKLYREFMIMGFISFALYLSNEAYAGEWYMSFHFSHILLVFIGLTFLVQAAVLVTLIASRNKTLLRHDTQSCEDLLIEYIDLLSTNGITRKLFDYGPVSIPIPELREKIEYKILQEYFIRLYNLPAEFKFANYMSLVLKKYVISLVEVRPINWLALVVFASLNYARIALIDKLYQDKVCEKYPDENAGAHRFLAGVGQQALWSTSTSTMFRSVYTSHTFSTAASSGEETPHTDDHSGDYAAVDPGECQEYILRYVSVCLLLMTLFLIGVWIASEIYIHRLIDKVLDVEETLEWIEEEEELEMTDYRDHSSDPSAGGFVPQSDATVLDAHTLLPIPKEMENDETSPLSPRTNDGNGDIEMAGMAQRARRGTGSSNVSRGRDRRRNSAVSELGMEKEHAHVHDIETSNSFFRRHLYFRCLHRLTEKEFSFYQGISEEEGERERRKSLVSHGEEPGHDEDDTYSLHPLATDFSPTRPRRTSTWTGHHPHSKEEMNDLTSLRMKLLDLKNSKHNMIQKDTSTRHSQAHGPPNGHSPPLHHPTRSRPTSYSFAANASSPLRSPPSSSPTPLLRSISDSTGFDEQERKLSLPPVDYSPQESSQRARSHSALHGHAHSHVAPHPASAIPYTLSTLEETRSKLLALRQSRLSLSVSESQRKLTLTVEQGPIVSPTYTAGLQSHSGDNNRSSLRLGTWLLPEEESSKEKKPTPAPAHSEASERPQPTNPRSGAVGTSMLARLRTSSLSHSLGNILHPTHLHQNVSDQQQYQHSIAEDVDSEEAERVQRDARRSILHDLKVTNHRDSAVSLAGSEKKGIAPTSDGHHANGVISSEQQPIEQGPVKSKPKLSAKHKSFSTEFFDVDSNKKRAAMQAAESPLERWSSETSVPEIEPWYFLSSFRSGAARCWVSFSGAVKRFGMSVTRSLIGHQIGEVEADIGEDLEQAQRTLASIYLWHNPFLYYFCIEMCLLLQCVYIALWATNFVVLALDSYNPVFWEIILLLPLPLNFFIIKEIIYTSCMLKSISALDKQVCDQVCEDALDERNVTRRLRLVIRNALREESRERPELTKDHWEDFLSERFLQYTEVQRKFFENMSSKEREAGGLPGNLSRSDGLLETQYMYYLTKKSFKAFLHSLHIFLTDESVSKIFVVIDADKNKKLRWEDFHVIVFPELRKKTINVKSAKKLGNSSTYQLSNKVLKGQSPIEQTVERQHQELQQQQWRGVLKNAANAGTIAEAEDETENESENENKSWSGDGSSHEHGHGSETKMRYSTRASDHMALPSEEMADGSPYMTARDCPPSAESRPSAAQFSPSASSYALVNTSNTGIREELGGLRDSCTVASRGLRVDFNDRVEYRVDDVGVAEEGEDGDGDTINSLSSDDSSVGSGSDDDELEGSVSASGVDE
jgi:hypothetical protein